MSHKLLKQGIPLGDSFYTLTVRIRGSWCQKNWEIRKFPGEVITNRIFVWPLWARRGYMKSGCCILIHVLLLVVPCSLCASWLKCLGVSRQRFEIYHLMQFLWSIWQLGCCNNVYQWIYFFNRMWNLYYNPHFHNLYFQF